MAPESGSSAPAAAATAAAATPSFHQLLAWSDAAFLIMSPADAVPLYVSPSAAHVFGAAPAALLGRSMVDSVHAEDRPHLAAMVRAVSAAAPCSAPSHAHLRLLRGAPAERAPSSWIWAEFKLFSDGEFLYGVVRDVTREKKVEETLRRFLLTTSHDLRTPCHGAQCASALLAARPGIADDAEALYLLGAVRASCRLMLGTIENVLLLKALEAAAAAGRAPVLAQRQRLDVRSLLADVLEVCRIGCGADVVGGAHASAGADVPMELEGDAEKLRQVLQNAAAVVARWAADAPGGSVAASLTRCGDDDAADAAATSAGVHDLVATFTAVGRRLSPAEAGAAFEPYASCAGLALLVARAFARAMRGNAWLEEGAEGARLCVRFRLLAPGAPEQPDDHAQPSLPSLLPPPPPSPLATPLPEAQRVELTQRLFEHLATMSDDMFSIGDMSGGGALYEYVSSSVSRWGLDAVEMTGLDAKETMHPDDVPRIQAQLGDAVARSAAQGGAAVPFVFERRMRLPGNTFAMIHSSGCVEGSKWLAVCKLLREQQAKEDGVRSLLLSISHELRTPAQSGLAAAALLARRACVAADAETAFLVQAISASCGLLLGMVANALSMRGIESGELAMHVAPFEPRAAVADVLKVCRLGRRARDIAWMDEAAPLPTETHGDRTFFCQILQNLVTNACKFEDGGGVVVRMRCSAEETHDAAGTADGVADGDTPPRRTHVLEASVADRGRGMSAQQCDSIFQPYEAAASSAGGGTGLGLFISRACARRSGGDVSVVSAPGRGATFTLRFPVHVPRAAAAAWAAAAAAFRQQPKQSPTPPAAPAAPPPGTPSPAKRARVEGGAAAAAAPACATASPPELRCLLADDAMLNLLLVQRLLQQHAGFAVRTAVNGREAYDLLVAACVAGEPPHIAVLDMQMPQMSGPGAARAFRAWEAAHRPRAPRTPMYCLTANVLEEHRAECDAAGFDGFLTKPLRADALTELRVRAAEHADALTAYEAHAGGA